MAIKKLIATFAQLATINNRFECVKQPYETGGILQAQYAPINGVQLAINHADGTVTQVTHFIVKQPMFVNATVRYYADVTTGANVGVNEEIEFIISYPDDSV